MAWTDITPGGSSDGADFIRLKNDGDVVKVHVILQEGEEPVSFSSAFFKGVGAKGRTAIIGEGSPLEGMEKEYSVRKKHAIPVVDMSDGKIKVLEMSNTLANTVKGIYEEYQGFDTIDLKITRNGSGLQTKYAVVPVPTKYSEDTIEGQERPDFEKLYAPFSNEDIEKMMAGEDPSADRVIPEKDAAEAPAEEAPAEVEAEEEEAAPAPVKKAAVAPKAAAKAAAPAPAAQRAVLLQAIKANFGKLKRYTAMPKNQIADIKKFGGADKIALSQCSVEAMAKLLAFQKTQK